MNYVKFFAENTGKFLAEEIQKFINKYKLEITNIEYQYSPPGNGSYTALVVFKDNNNKL